jgi:hypothetical protein
MNPLVVSGAGWRAPEPLTTARDGRVSGDGNAVDRLVSHDLS